MNISSLDGGFQNAPTDAAVAFRAIMNVMARPGTVETLGGAVAPYPISKAASTLLLTMCDADTPIHLASKYDNKEIRDWIAFHIGAPIVERSASQFALGGFEDLLPLADYPIGTSEYPDRSTTLIVEMDELAKSGATFTGPGIKTTAQFGLPGDAKIFQNNASRFPLGLDFFFTAGSQVAALPRTTKVA